MRCKFIVQDLFLVVQKQQRPYVWKKGAVTPEYNEIALAKRWNFAAMAEITSMASDSFR